ncbi:hypothetical protein [Leifsonia aquatica]|uniref:hypothetical protein n=1 Tax=Leifsonia aquatica TaxID=144185 RepID=UPI0004688166|nr:hypothetical protein [Leifsonia aquatica]
MTDEDPTAGQDPGASDSVSSAPGAAGQPAAAPAEADQATESSGTGEQPGDIPFEQAAAEHENPALG